MSKKGMRLVAMIEKKENGQYDVVNFLPDITIKHITGKEFEVIEEKDHIQIPYAQGINDLTVIVGENGVGKTRLVNDIFSLDEKKLFVFEKVGQKNVDGRRKLIYYNRSDASGGHKCKNFLEINIRGVDIEQWDSSMLLRAGYTVSIFIEKVLTIRFSHTIESSRLRRGIGFDLSTSNTISKEHLAAQSRLDMYNHILFLINDSLDMKNIETFLEFSRKQLIFSFNDYFITEKVKFSFEISDERLYIDELIQNSFKRFDTIEEKLNFYLTDYLAYVYSNTMIDRFAYDRLGEMNYIGLLNNLDNMIVERKNDVKNFLVKTSKEARNMDKDANDYISNKIVHLSKNDTIKSVIKAGYKYQFYNYSRKKRVRVLKKYIDLNCRDLFNKIDEFFNISGNIANAPFNLERQLSQNSLKIIFNREGTRSRYVIEEGDYVQKLHAFQSYIHTNESCLIPKSNSWVIKNFLKNLINSLTFQWQGLSSGQLALLNLFGRLHSLAEEVKDKESILLLLDEVDLGLHPEWQRKWISTALPIIGEIFKGKHVQIILTTHSPIMLSDIYGENVLMLRKDTETGERQVVYGDEVPSTSFGQNIHQLFKESFFLEQTKGEYSLKIINATIKAIYDLNQEGADVTVIKANFASELGVEGLSDSKFRAYLEKVMGAIGEKVIAQKLQDMYQTIPLWSQASSLEGKRAGDLSTEELRQLLRQREEAGQ